MRQYFYAKPNSMFGGRFGGDVAITEAASKDDALEHFKVFFPRASIEFVHHVRYDRWGVCVLTDF